MRYQFSGLLSCSESETQGLCEGIPIRKHLRADLEEVGTFRAQLDWSKLVKSTVNYKGGLGPRYNFMAVSLPECIPERFEIVSYANEFAFLHDDITDIASYEEGQAENDEMLKAFQEGARSGTIDKLDSGKREMQAMILSTMMSLDRERALSAMEAWATFLEQGAGRQHHTRFHTLDEYLPYRAMDVGHMFWHALVTFGCAIKIPEHENDLCRELVVPAVFAASLTNDLFSFTKEYEAAKKAGLPDVVNALWVLMHQHNIPLAEAESRCRMRIREEVAKYVQVVKDTKARTDISDGLKRYVELMQYSVSGNVVWSLQCPRYHENVQYNDEQIRQARLNAEMLKDTFKPHHREKVKRSNSENDQQSSLNSPQDRKMARRDSDENVKKCSLSSNETDGLTHTSTDEAHDSSNESKGQNGSAEDITPRSSTGATSNDTGSGNCHGLVLKRFKKPDDTAATEPYRYLKSLPSKGIRDKIIDALNVWLELPLKTVDLIKSIISMLHGTSLMLDDIEDNSDLRRGRPSTHIVFGTARTINSATLQYVEVIEQVRQLTNQDCIDIFIDEMRQLFVGQGYDLLWAWHVTCPSLPDYLQMVDGKTGGMFRLLTRLMAAESSKKIGADLDYFCCLIGRYFQIRDDYQNLVSLDQYEAQKGFCEDLDEGKYSLPLILALQKTTNRHQLQSLLMQRRVKGRMTREQKQFMLDIMKDAGILKETQGWLQTLVQEIEVELARLEASFGRSNHQLSLMLRLLRV